MAVHPARKPWWQQATALVTVSTGGVITGLNFAPGTAATLTAPAGVPLHLMALDKAGAGELGATPGAGAASGDSVLRPAIVNIAKHYLQLAKSKSPAEMEALIWGEVSADGADHGPSCAAFASLTLELAAQAAGQQSWVTGGSSYPWPVHSWADVRVDPNPDSLTIISVAQDAKSHGRWHPLGDGYTPQPGDWVLFNEHVEVVTSYSGGVLHTIGANSPPNSSVNAHSYPGPLSGDSVQGFVDNGNLTAKPGAHPAPAPATTKPAPKATPPSTAKPARTQPKPSTPPAPSASPRVKEPGAAAIPGLAPVVVPGLQPAAQEVSGHGRKAPGRRASGRQASIPGLVAPPATAPSAAPRPAPSTPAKGTPGKDTPTSSPAAPTPTPSHTAPTHTAPTHTAPTHTAPAKPYQRHSAPAPSSAPGTSSQQGFISAVSPGAMAAQQRWGVPAAVTIAQAIEESAWGQSGLAATYHNLFGIKGTGPAGSVMLPTQEFENGQWVTIDAPFRVYHNDAESIADHAELLATSGYYTRAMADRAFPDAFASDLTGVYATDPAYGSNLIALMKLYNLYQYNAPAAAPHASSPPATTPASPAPTPTATTPSPTRTRATAPPTTAPATTAPATTAPAPTASAPTTHAPASPAPGKSRPPAPTATPTPTGGQPRIPGMSPAPVGTPRVPRTASAPRPSRPAPARGAAPARGGTIPGLVSVPPSGPTGSYGAPAGRTAPRPGTSRTTPAPATTGSAVGNVTTMAYVRTAPPGTAARPAGRYAPAPKVAQPRPERLFTQELPDSVKTAFFTSARTPIFRAEPMYKDIANQAGISWKLLAACDWMQCQAQPHVSPVHGEKLGTLNADGTVYTTKSAALTQCAMDLVELAFAVYGIDLTVPRRMSVKALADVFAAFRWGGLLRRHGVSSMEFPYSVEGLTSSHVKMRWPAITEPNAPDKPGARFKMPFGAVPLVLSLNYRATV